MDKIFKCPECSKEFDTKQKCGAHRFPAHRIKITPVSIPGERKIPQYKDKICKKCGKIYTPNSGCQKFCHECLTKRILCQCYRNCGKLACIGSNYAHGHAPFKQRKCIVCGEMYIPTGRRQKRCDGCRLKRNPCECGCGGLADPDKRFITGHQNRGRIFKGKKCLDCGGIFDSTNGSRKWCEVCNAKRMEKGVCEREGCNNETKPRTRFCSSNRSRFCSSFCRGGGENSPRWKGGISKDLYGEDFTKELRIEIKKRDKYICQLCGKTEKEEKSDVGYGLSVHHIDYDKKNNGEDNLIALCQSCNSKVNAKRAFWTGFLIGVLFKRGLKNDPA